MTINFKDLLKGKVVEEAQVIKRPMLPLWVALLVSVIAAFLIFFFTLPALNPRSYDFYVFTGGVLLIFMVLLSLTKWVNSKAMKLLPALIMLCVLIPVFFTLIGSPIFWAKSYANLINVDEGIFSEHVSSIDFDQYPIVDKEAAQVIGQKQMGSIPDLVSQFEIDNTYSQVNIKGKPVRISTLKYYDLFKYLGNNQNGIQHYVSVDMTTQESSLNKLEDPIFYSKSDYLMRNIDRHLRFQYPFSMFGETNLELDDEGKAFFVTPVITKRIALMSGTDASGVIVTDANSGESVRYSDEIPTWVDRVYQADLIINQLNARGSYNGGFFNSVFGQRGVTSTTEGYNYVSIGEDIYLTTGVTSVRSDESNLGFYYVNLRTKDAKFYPVPSAIETQAMQSARGKVQEKDYVPTFPIVLNLAGRPVYFMSLKDNAKTAKMFAIVDAQQFNEVIVGDTVQQVVNNYTLANAQNTEVVEESTSQRIVIEQIKEAVVDGNTMYFLTVRGEDRIFIATAKQLGTEILKLKEGESLEVEGTADDTQFIILKITN